MDAGSQVYVDAYANDMPWGQYLAEIACMHACMDGHTLTQGTHTTTMHRQLTRQVQKAELASCWLTPQCLHQQCTVMANAVASAAAAC